MMNMVSLFDPPRFRRLACPAFIVAQSPLDLHPRLPHQVIQKLFYHHPSPLPILMDLPRVQAIPGKPQASFALGG